MVTINVNLPIGHESENKWMAMWGEENVVFSLDTIRRIFEENKEETDFKFNFDCVGGYVDEGFKIYDYIRTSGKNIHCNIEGGCHSMAIVMLLAAPSNQRTANKHATSLIHCLRSEICGALTSDQLKEIAENMDSLEDKMLDIYVDRCGGDKEELRALMHEEKERDTNFLIEHGFIDHVNPYNTNSKGSRQIMNNNPQNSQHMTSMLKDAVESAKALLNKLTEAVDNEPAKTFDHKNADGVVMFTTNVEDETLEVGMSATPDGVHTLTDSRVVTIENGLITNIAEPAPVADPKDEEITNLKSTIDELNAKIETINAENATLQAQNAELISKMEEATNAINDATKLVEELKSQISSNYKPKNAQRTAPTTSSKNEETIEEHKATMRAKLGLA